MSTCGSTLFVIGNAAPLRLNLGVGTIGSYDTVLTCTLPTSNASAVHTYNLFKGLLTTMR